MVKWLLAGVVMGGLGAGAALYEPGVRISRVGYNRLVGDGIEPAEAVYWHSRRGCRLAADNVETVPAGAVPPDASPCPSCRMP